MNIFTADKFKKLCEIEIDNMNNYWIVVKRLGKGGYGCYDQFILLSQYFPTNIHILQGWNKFSGAWI